MSFGGTAYIRWFFYARNFQRNNTLKTSHSIYNIATVILIQSTLTQPNPL